jgi:hypothetical protein
MEHFIYYLAILNNPVFYGIEDVYEDLSDEDTSDIIEFDLETFKGHDIQFLIGMPDLYGSLAYCDDIKHEEVIKGKELSDLIFNFIYDTEVIEEMDEEGMDDKSKVETFDKRKDLLIDEYLVIKENTETKKYSIVSKNELISCCNSTMKMAGQSPRP